MENEEWRPIPGYEGLYEVSSLGRVKRLRTMVRGPHGSIQSCPECVLTPSASGPYPSVKLCRDGCGHTYRLHVLVLTAFVGPRPEGMEARHFPDRSKTNNRLDNLSWGTKKQNAADKELQGQSQRGGLNHQAKLSEEDVRAIRRLWAEGRLKQPEIGEMFGIKQQQVSRLVNRKRWSHVE